MSQSALIIASVFALFVIWAIQRGRLASYTQALGLGRAGAR